MNLPFEWKVKGGVFMGQSPVSGNAGGASLQPLHGKSRSESRLRKERLESSHANLGATKLGPLCFPN